MAGKHRFHVSVDYVVEIDPDRVEEYVGATFDGDTERVTLSDLTRGNDVAAPIVLERGPHVEELVRDD